VDILDNPGVHCPFCRLSEPCGSGYLRTTVTVAVAGSAEVEKLTVWAPAPVAFTTGFTRTVMTSPGAASKPFPVLGVATAGPAAGEKLPLPLTLP